MCVDPATKARNVHYDAKMAILRDFCGLHGPPCHYHPFKLKKLFVSIIIAYNSLFCEVLKLPDAFLAILYVTAQLWAPNQA